MARKRTKRCMWSKLDMEKAVDMYINGRTSGLGIATKMNVPLQTLYLRVIKRLMDEKKLESQKKDDESINENSNQFPSTSNFIPDDSVIDLNSMQDEQIHLVDITSFSSQSVENQLPQKQNHQENVLINNEHKISENNAGNEKDLVNEECDLFGKYIINQLKQYNNQTRALVKHKFQSILFEAEMGKFTVCKEEPQEYHQI